MSLIIKDVPQREGQVQVQIHIEADLHISALIARRRVTGYLIDYVSDHLGGDQPILVVDDEQFLWRVPVMLYLTSRGKVGKVGEIDVDAQTGQLFISADLLGEIKKNATSLTICTTS